MMAFNFQRIVIVFLVALVTREASVVASKYFAKQQAITKRQAVDPLPTVTCNKANQGEVWTGSQNTPISTIWVCQNSRWIPHMVTPSTGKTPQVAGKSCKDIRDTLTNDCSGLPPTSSYWVNVTDVCGEVESMRVFCDMSTDGGGWTLVWKHSYTEVGPLNDNMKYFSNHPRPCTDIETGWCNMPYKARLNPTEMMIVAYHNKSPRYAYKGWFNHNIDYNWRGGILVEPMKILDHCPASTSVNIEPAPSVHRGRSGVVGYFL